MVKNKIKTLKSLKKTIHFLKKRGKSAVFTNGCFDILHKGHINYLEKASTLADTLIVAINSDASVRALKGRSRPLFAARDRALAVAALEFVDYVVVFGEKTPFRIIKALKPNILVKGADWKKSHIVGRDTVESYGGRVVRIPLVKGYSTSTLIAKIRKK